MMTDAAAKLMSVEDFVFWQQSQEHLDELVEGAPSLYRGPKAAAEMMAGGSSLHDWIITNIIIALGNQLGEGPCRPATAALGLRTNIRSLRRADVLVTCEPPSSDTYEAIEPRMVVEGLSPSNVGVAWERKLNEYRRHGKPEYILLVDARVMDVKLYARTAAGWDDADFADAGDEVALPALGCSLTLAAIYRGTGLEGGR
jgi:Uma2 family endonuclease